MTSIAVGTPFVPSQLKRLDSSNIRLQQLSAEEAQEALAKMQELKETFYSQAPQLSKHPAYEAYATVEVGGEVVATVNNHGGVIPSNGLSMELLDLLPGSPDDPVGPGLAQQRAEFLADKLGGTVVAAETAISQADFDSLPPPVMTPDFAAAQAQLLKAKQAETEFRTQQIAQEGGAEQVSAFSGSDDEDNTSEAVKAFLDYMSMSPEERYFDAFLKSKGMTQEEFDALPPEEKQALMTEFEEAVKQHVENEVNEQLAKTENIGPL